MLSFVFSGGGNSDSENSDSAECPNTGHIRMVKVRKRVAVVLRRET